MLRDRINTGDQQVSGIFINQKQQISQGKMFVYCTDRKEILIWLKEQKVPAVFLEKEGTAPVFEADYVWQGNGLPEAGFLRKVWNRFYRLPMIIAHSERILIRESIPEDYEALAEFYQEEAENPDVQGTEKISEDQFLSYITNRYSMMDIGLWTVAEKESGQPIGRMGIQELPKQYERLSGKAELSYLIGRKYRKQGYAYEAGRMILEYLKEEYGPGELLLRTSKQNLASQRLAEKMGFHIWEEMSTAEELLYRQIY